MNTDLDTRNRPALVPPGTTQSLPPPQVGDILTLYPLTEAAPYLGMKVPTLRRNISTGTIPRQFLTKTPGRIYLSGDQIHQLLAFMREVDWTQQPPATPPPGARAHQTRPARRRTG